ncbi:MAG: glucose-6-phosphate dehydrogenase [bacterium]|nr:glucose-6-phosphate dehydrogenase [bacterium]
MRAKQADSFTFVIFGATGDLTQRKLIPALFNLFLDGFLGRPFSVIGFARREKSDAQFRAEMGDAIRKYSRRQAENPDQLERFLDSLGYVQGTFEVGDGYVRLKKRIVEMSMAQGSPENVMYYLATPPDAFPQILTSLQANGLVSGHGEHEPWSRIVIEKPFGHDASSAGELNKMVHSVFAERQVYRIDHYLGKETVQNILVFRLANAIFEPLWNRRYIDHIQISVAESLGVGSRAGYFDEVGIIRDMIQSHIMQVFTLIAMEPPASFDATAIRDEKVKVLKALRQISDESLSEYSVRGQYGPGSIGGEAVAGYRNEDGVPSNSMTDTFVALKLYVDNWRWSGVPFYLRSGKRLPKRVTEVGIVFKAPPHLLFNRTEGQLADTNVLRFRIQPQEGITLSFQAKMPGQEVRISPVRMDFMYASAFEAATSEAYERLILDALTGDSTLFAREDEVELSWRLVDRIIASWRGSQLQMYEAGTWGPDAADAFLARDGREWLRL